MDRRFFAAALLFALSTPATAHADAVATVVTRDEILIAADAVDSFEIVCKGTAAALCVKSEDRGTPDDPMLMTLVGTSPAVMLGAAEAVELAAGETNGACLTRRAFATTMKAIVTFAARHDAKLPATYTMVASCLDSIGNPLPIKVRSKQQETQF
jgi:hypothetical protein